MEDRPARIHVAWPEDYVLAGDELEALHAQLTPHSERLNNLISQVGTTALETIEVGEEVILSTLNTLDRPVSNRNLQDIINDCLRRNDHQDNLFINIERQDVISLAFWRLADRGNIAIEPSGVRLIHSDVGETTSAS